MKCWIVTYKGKIMDKVFFESTCDADYVRRSLIEHDGYGRLIKVKEEKSGQ